MVLLAAEGERAGQDEKSAETDLYDAGAQDDENAGETRDHSQSASQGQPSVEEENGEENFSTAAT
jgi:hypothetical protein